MKAALVLIAISFCCTSAFAAGGEGVPWDMILKQTISFLIVVGLLYALLGKHVVTLFRERAESFEKLLNAAKQAREDAEAQREEILQRLQKLESTAQSSIESARAEAEQLKLKIRSEAEYVSKQIRDEAQRTAAREIDRAKQELKQEALQLAMAQTRESLRTNVAEPDQKRLQNEFVDKIQVVR